MSIEIMLLSEICGVSFLMMLLGEFQDMSIEK